MLQPHHFCHPVTRSDSISNTEVEGAHMKVFLDTMIFLHYRSLEQLNLAEILGPPPHNVLVPRITLRELDKHKNTHRSSRIQERARKVLQKIERWVKGEEIRLGVSAEFLSAMPMVDYEKLGLNPDWSDDILIATVFQFNMTFGHIKILTILSCSTIMLPWIKERF